MKSVSSSWNKSSHWYGTIVGESGHYYHQHVVLPAVLKLLQLNNDSKLLDVGCGQGVLARAVPNTVEYWGVDVAALLIKQAKSLSSNQKHRFVIADVTKQLPVPQHYFSHAAVVLALQNMSNTPAVIKNISAALKEHGTLVLVLNHPCFRIPRQSGWEVDDQSKQQRRWVNRYLTPMDIPVLMHPGQRQSDTTYSYHLPLSSYVQALTAAGFIITGMEELVSDKESVGKAAKIENRSRNEIPLFLAIKAIKSS